MSGCLDGYQVIVPLIIPEEKKNLVANIYKLVYGRFEEIEAIGYEEDYEPLARSIEGITDAEAAMLGCMTVIEAKLLIGISEEEMASFLNDPLDTFCKYNYVAATTFTTAKQSYVVAFAGEITYGDIPCSSEYCLLAAVNSVTTFLLETIL